MKKGGVAFLALFLVSFVLAGSANVTLVGEIGSFSGAIMKVESPVSGSMSEKIKPYEYLASVGVLKFVAETSLQEVYLNFIITKNGEVVNEVRRGPFEINGSEITVDLRDKVALEVVKDAPETVEEVVENVSNESVLAEEVLENISEEKVVVEEEGPGFFDDLFLTGKAIFVRDDGSFKAGFSIGTMLVLIVFVSFILMARRRGKKTESAGDILAEEDKELDEITKKVKDTEARISRAKSKQEKEAKINAAKAKLEKEKRELAELEKKEAATSEMIEDAD